MGMTDVLLEIFSYVSVLDVLNLKLVCKKFYNICCSDALWSTFLMDLPGIDLPSKDTEELVFRHMWMNSVGIRSYYLI